MDTEIKDELDRIKGNVAAAYTAAEEQGADMPESQNTDNLAETVGSIKSVKFTEQALTDDQQEQARTNIGAASQKAFDQFFGMDGDDDIIDMLLEIDALPALFDENGAVYTDENGAILLNL